MMQFSRRALLGTIALLCLLAGMAAPVPLQRAAAADTPLADLVIEDISWNPREPAQGESVTFTVTVRNQGAGRAEATQLECFIDDAAAAQIKYGSIDPGVTTTCTFSWTAASGQHNIRAIIDPGNEIEESDDGNNDVSFAFSVLTPDLIIESITWEPQEAEIREPVIFSVTIKNRGTQYARASNVELFVDGFSRGYYPTPALPAGANFTQQYYWTAQAGPHNVSAVADVLGQVTESDEVNNERTVRYASASPDLVVSQISWGSVSASGNITVKLKIENQGTGKSDPCYLNYYIDSYLLGSAYVTPIAAEATLARSFSWEVRPGSHNIRAVVDSDNSVYEEDETNNETTALYTLDGTAADLVIQSISWTPAQPLAKHRLTINVVMENRGDAIAIRPALKVIIDDVEEFPQQYWEIPAGATVNKTIPWTLPSGSHTITVIADPDDDVPESNESNNTKSATVKSNGPASYALSLGAVTKTPDAPGVGDTVTFSVQVKNGSLALSSPFHLAYYIDHQLWDTDYVGALGANKAVTKEYDWAAVPGRHTFTAVVDANDIIPEGNEADNEKSLEVYVAAPDLVIENVSWTPAEPEAGDTVIYTVNIRNKGGLTAGRSSTAYYVDGISRGHHGLPEIAPGASATSTFTWTVEQDAHTVLIKADADETLTEENETNNAKSVTLPAPDITIGGITWTPAEPSGNATVTFNVNLGNDGAGPAAASRLAAYIDDAPIGHDDTPAILPGGSANGSFSWKLAPGTHIFKAVAEADGQITEADESNNEKIAAIYVSPAAAAAAAAPAAGETGAVSEATDGPAEPDEADMLQILTAEAEAEAATEAEAGATEEAETAELPADVGDSPLTLPVIGALPSLGSWSGMWMIGGGVIVLAAAAILVMRLRGRGGAKTPEEKAAEAAAEQQAAAAKQAAKAKKAAAARKAAAAKQAPQPQQAQPQQPQAQAQAQPQQPQAQAQAQPPAPSKQPPANN